MLCAITSDTQQIPNMTVTVATIKVPRFRILITPCVYQDTNTIKIVTHKKNKSKIEQKRHAKQYRCSHGNDPIRMLQPHYHDKYNSRITVTLNRLTMRMTTRHNVDNHVTAVMSHNVSTTVSQPQYCKHNVTITLSQTWRHNHKFTITMSQPKRHNNSVAIKMSHSQCHTRSVSQPQCHNHNNTTIMSQP